MNARSILVGFMLILPAASHSAPLTWTFEDVQFDGGSVFGIGVLTGSFIYDAGVNEYSEVVVQLSLPSTAVPFFVSGNSTSSLLEVLLIDICCVDALPNPHVFAFVSPLGNTGGSIDLDLTLSSVGQSLGDLGSASLDVLSGRVTAVPLPAPVLLLGSALACLVFRRRQPD